MHLQTIRNFLICCQETKYFAKLESKACLLELSKGFASSKEFRIKVLNKETKLEKVLEKMQEKKIESIKELNEEIH